MLVDRATLRDLEILDASDGATPLVALLDHTHTASGSDRLRARLRQPLATLGEIHATQAAVRHLGPRLDVLRGVLAQLPTGEVERYLSLRWELARSRSRPARAVEAAWLRIRYPEGLRDLHRGAAVAKVFIDGLDASRGRGRARTRAHAARAAASAAA